MYLFGQAGTGKTATVVRIVMAALERGLTVAVCAPTHKAQHVIQDRVEGELGLPLCLGFRTIQSALQLGMYIDDYTGELEFFIQNNDRPGPCKNCGGCRDHVEYDRDYCYIQVPDLVIVDECTMLEARLVQQLHETLTQYGVPVKVLAVGDPMQLLPVSEAGSIVVNQSIDARHFCELQEVMRTNRPVLLDVYGAIRNWQGNLSGISNILMDMCRRAPPNSGCRFYEQQGHREALQRSIERGIVPTVLSYTNQSCIVHNDLIRRYMYQTQGHIVRLPEQLPRYLLGDKLVLNAPYPWRAINEDEPPRRPLHNGAVVIVKRIERELRTIAPDWASIPIEMDPDLHRGRCRGEPHAISLVCTTDRIYRNFIGRLVARCQATVCAVYRMDVELSDGRRCQILVLDTDTPDARIQAEGVETVRDRAQGMISKFQRDHQCGRFGHHLWGMYREAYITPFADVSYGHAITIHKSQGSTMANVIVDVANIGSVSRTSNEQKMRLLYTACTRASRTLWLLM